MLHTKTTKRCYPKNKRHQRGATLIELLLCLSTGLIVIGIGYQCLHSLERHMTKQRAVLNEQSILQHAYMLLFNAARASAFSVCKTPLAKTTLLNNTGKSLYTLVPVSVSQNFGPWGITRIKNGRVVQGSDVLITQFITNPVTLNKTLKAKAKAIYMSGQILFKKGDIVIVTNCKSTWLVRVKKVTSRTIALVHGAPVAFTGKTIVGVYHLNAFYVGQDAQHKRALYGIDAGFKKHELVPGIAGLTATLNSVSLSTEHQNLEHARV
jgi:Tfp pilus assembly protein PilW